MSYNLVNPTTGDLTRVAGLSGELVPSVALKQSGQVNFSCDANSWTTVDVTFATPMPDTDYLVNTDSGETEYVHVQVATTKRTTGFTMIIWNRDTVSNTGIIRWTAFKLMTDTVHEADAAHIAQNTANFAPAFSEVTSYAIGDYVTYNNVLYRCTTAHTAGVWVAGHFTQVTVGGDFVSQSKLHTLDVWNSQTTLTRVQRLKIIITDYVTDYGSYIMFIELAGEDYGQIVLSRRLTTDVVRGTATVGTNLYVISGTMSNLIITEVS